MTGEAKRPGRPTKTPITGERVSLGLRVTADAKRRLDKAAVRSGRSQSQEAELRLEQSFELERRFGGPEMVAIANLMAGAFLRGGQQGAVACQHPEWSPAEWMQSPVCYEAAITTVVDALTAARPAFEYNHPDAAQRALMKKIDQTFARLAAAGYDVRRIEGRKSGDGEDE